MTAVRVKITNEWDECGHAGCSGPEVVTLEITINNRLYHAKHASCFGVSMEELIAEVIQLYLDDRPQE